MLYMGVADGVGSWRDYGVDPREFSHKLLADCEEILNDAQSVSGHAIPTDELLAQSYERTKNSNTIGSSTACVALFDSVNHQVSSFHKFCSSAAGTTLLISSPSCTSAISATLESLCCGILTLKFRALFNGTKRHPVWNESQTSGLHLFRNNSCNRSTIPTSSDGLAKKRRTRIRRSKRRLIHAHHLFTYCEETSSSWQLTGFLIMLTSMM